MTADLQIVTRPTLISVPTVATAAAGGTVAEIVAAQLSGATIGAVMVEINGEPVPRADWETVRPAPGDHLLIYTSVGRSGKNPLATLLSIVVVAAAAAFGGPLGGAIGKGLGATWSASTAAAVGMATISTAGGLLVSALVPSRTPAYDTHSYADSPTYSVSGTQNAPNPWGPVPVMLGRHRVYPPLGARTYTELEGQDEYVRILVVWGYGPLLVESIKIGDTLISSFTDVEIQTINGWPGQSNDLSLFPGSVTQNQIGAALTNSGGWISRTAPAGSDELSIEITFDGLVVIDSSTAARTTKEVEFDIEYGITGSGVWTALTGASGVAFGAATLTPNVTTFMLWSSIAEGYNSVYAYPDGNVSLEHGLYEKTNAKRIAQFYLDIIPSGDPLNDPLSVTYTIRNVTALSPTGVTGMVVSLNAGAQDMDMTAGTVDFSDFSCSGKTIEQLRFGTRWPVDRSNQYDVRIRRTTADSASDYDISDSTWAVLRGVANDPPLNFSFPVAATALRIKASDQINGVIDNISAVITSIVPTWNGSDWSTWAASSNPAALYRHVLTCDANIKARTAAQIDGDGLADWYDFCTTGGYSFNMYRDFRSSVRECLADVAAAGFASPAMTDGKWGVVVDRFDKSIAQHFTPRNSWGFSAEKLLVNHPHAVRVRFKNEDADWEWDERIVYADGYTSATATLFEQWEFPGVTDSDLIWKFARRRMATAKLRPEFYSFYTDYEHLSCQRGSLIRMSHDVILVGLGAGRIKSITSRDVGGTDYIDTIVVDETLTMAAGTVYAIRVRKTDGTSQVMICDTVAGENTTLAFTGNNYATATGPAAGDLFSFGVSGSETGQYLVYAVEPIDDLNAKIIAVDYAPAIDTADSGSIPAYSPGTTQPIDITRIAPEAPSIINVDSGTRALEVTGTIIRPRILATVSLLPGTVRVGSYRFRYRITGTALWQYATIELPNATAVLADVIEGETYTIQAQAISMWGTAGAWSTAVTEEVIGQSELPSDISDLAVNIVGDQAYLSWPAVLDLDLSHYRIRYSPETSGATWVRSVDLVARVGKDSTSITVPAMVGTYMVKAVDRGGRESANAAVESTSIARVAGLNVVTTFGQAHAAWSGSGTDCSVDLAMGGIALDDPETAAIGYYAFASYEDLGAIYTSRLTAQLWVNGQDLAADLYNLTDLYASANLYGDVEGLYDIELQVALTDDDPAGTPTWGAWKRFTVGDYTARAFKFRAKLIGTAPSITPILEEFEVTIDMPDRTYAFAAAIASGGSRVTFTPAFRAKPEIGLAVVDGQEGDKYTISSHDETGFNIAFTNGGSNVARNISGVAEGYGYEE